MKLALLLLAIVFSLAQTQSSLPTGGGLVITNVSFEQKLLKTPAIPKSMVSQDPPKLNPDPNLGRVDRHESPVNAEKQEKARLIRWKTSQTLSFSAAQKLSLAEARRSTQFHVFPG